MIRTLVRLWQRRKTRRLIRQGRPSTWERTNSLQLDTESLMSLYPVIGGSPLPPDPKRYAGDYATAYCIERRTAATLTEAVTHARERVTAGRNCSIVDDLPTRPLPAPLAAWLRSASTYITGETETLLLPPLPSPRAVAKKRHTLQLKPLTDEDIDHAQTYGW